MKHLLIITILLLSCSSDNHSHKKQIEKSEPHPINCSEKMCYGYYSGKEFVNGSDVAHQFSNKMSGVVGDKLKELYDQKIYSKVAFENIVMRTEGMGTGIVKYELTIPFIQVSSKCAAYTSFDHVGGWNHAPELENRKKQLNSVLLEGDKLNISQLKTTKEGLQEYWIQWRNKDKQKSCLNQN